MKTCKSQLKSVDLLKVIWYYLVTLKVTKGGQTVNTNKLRGKMAENGITIGRLAELIGVTSNTVSAWLKSGNIKSKHMADIAAVLNLSPEDTIAIFFSDK